ncbi:hypothetical protein CIB95_14885 [Lottiidibacillus patelloidae]|uniref:HupE/UreJ protein n=2 Tax=Lottiidibacillus patelloidae TaxID=2670334 RepID=A0A263BQU6_9BACI|nr:hypothetical protein CIB95_14885 [Lottiidibacillus patelloidae]
MITSFFLFLTTASLHTFAHPLSASYGELLIEDENIHLSFSIDELSVIESVSADQNGDEKLDEEELKEAQYAITDWVTVNLQVTVNNVAKRPNITSMFTEKRGDKMVVSFEIDYPIDSGTKTIQLTDHFYYKSPDKTSYTHFLVVKHKEEINEYLLKGENRSLSLEVKEETSGKEIVNTEAKAAWLQFLILGMEHILTGFDHLLFLLALLLARQKFKDYLKVVTSFTIAHSITLTLGYLGFISIPSWIVEAIIALSIVYVAVENIFRKTVHHRWTLTFLFGLIHGLGFAGLLMEMDIPKGHLTVSLFSFNVGIEIIQIVLVALVLPALIFLQRKANYLLIMKGTSIALAIIGFFWFIERIL